ncbi:hypothetical protein BC830DRAFT_1175967 [Chytriomyces sp. MP71]|nr:hypothetical protein BC830DRAFT_1175967 [Chytriomyces sp. MP71]
MGVKKVARNPGGVDLSDDVVADGLNGPAQCGFQRGFDAGPDSHRGDGCVGTESRTKDWQSGPLACVHAPCPGLSRGFTQGHSSLFAQLSAKHDPSLHPILEALTLLRRTQLALFESNARLDESTLVSIHANCARVESLLVNHQDSFHTDLFSASLLHHARTLRLTLLADALCNECNFKDASLALFKARQSLKQWVQQLNEVQSELGLELTSVLEKTTLSDEVPATAITSVTSSVPRRASSPPRRGNSLYEAISSAATNMASSIAKVGVSEAIGFYL